MGIHRVRMMAARRKLGELVNRAHLNDEAFRLERDGEPVAVLVSVRRWNRQEAELRALKPSGDAPAGEDAEPVPF
ncbi:MAG: type II toxin-antitoxin system Phd/YefM family antitoxin [Anaeromyxobacter sp.]|nr:type II toxin-antitoxin system Phd/YefM family antitoxin [Anaeromyxobacter sp.]MBL0276008.1 type II toxin-antitoxin system Phd/YefM family antitoxin [Anaeromyxobacter sp.]